MAMEQPGQSSKGWSRAWREIFGTRNERRFSLMEDGDSDMHHGFPSRTSGKAKSGDTEGQTGALGPSSGQMQRARKLSKQLVGGGMRSKYRV